LYFKELQRKTGSPAQIFVAGVPSHVETHSRGGGEEGAVERLNSGFEPIEISVSR
jgi:hypothetical protein